MEKRTFGKLELNRETLRNLTTEEMSQVVGGATEMGCGTGTATCDCTGTCRICDTDPSVTSC